MSLTTPLSVQKLQTALHDKAKGSPKFRFYALYDKVYREDVMAFAYECCKANRGAAGVDGQTFEDIEEYGVKKWLDELTQELKSRTYRPQPVRRVWIPKPDGKQRPLGVPAIKDRVAQTAAVLMLEPIFEADLQPEQYAYRADRSALDAVRHVHKLLNTGHEQIVDADLSGYFDSIPHADLLKTVARRIVDGAMLHLIKMWVGVPVEETDEKGNKHRSTRNRDEGRGTPQGAPISPLLSGRDGILALTWKQVSQLSLKFSSLNLYAKDAIPGSVLKIEDDNRHHITKEQRQLYCLAISAKRYVLFLLDEKGEPALLKKKINNKNDRWSKHGLGHLLNPTDPESEDPNWIAQVWLG